MIIFKVTKSQDFTLSLEDTFLEKPQLGVKLIPPLSLLRANLLDLDVNEKVQSFISLMLYFGMILTNNKPITRTNDRLPVRLTKLTLPIIFQFPFVISILPKRKMLRKNLYINTNSPFSQ